MTYINRVNKFYSTLYKRIGHFSYAPYGWEIFNRRTHGTELWGLGKVFIEIPMKVCLTPILLPATALTLAIAAFSALVVVATHILGLASAAALDAMGRSQTRLGLANTPNVIVVANFNA